VSQRSKLNPGSHKSAPRELIEHDVQTVNASFYSAKPHEYLQHRVTALLLLASRPQEVMQMASEGLSVGELKVKSEDPMRIPLKANTFSAASRTPVPLKPNTIGAMKRAGFDGGHYLTQLAFWFSSLSA